MRSILLVMFGFDKEMLANDDIMRIAYHVKLIANHKFIKIYISTA